jgi:ABC-2 type transport system permease protein
VIRLFLYSALYSYKALYRWLTWEAFIFQKTLFPLMQLSFFTLVGTYGGSQPASFYLVGNAVIVAFRPMLAVAMAIRDERSQGTLPYLVASPSNREILFFARAAFHAIDGMLDVLVAFVFAILIFGLDVPISTWPGILLSIVVASISACGLGFSLGALSYVMLDALFMGNLVMFSLLLLSGANVPLSDLPDIARAVGSVLPLTHSVEAARLFQSSAADFGAGVRLLLTDLLVGAAWAIAGLVLFAWFESQARQRGSLESADA